MRVTQSLTVGYLNRLVERLKKCMRIILIRVAGLKGFLNLLYIPVLHFQLFLHGCVTLNHRSVRPTIPVCVPLGQALPFHSRSDGGPPAAAREGGGGTEGT